jgi:prevent-host-death family protein
MCYMAPDKRVGVRELRQNLSVYLARVVDRGETLEVTDRGRSVALLAPLVPGEKVLSRLRREGRLVPASGQLLENRRPARTSRGAARELQRERRDRLL